MKHIYKIIILLFLAGVFTGGCSKGMTRQETKITKAHSDLCHAEIHKQWKHYTADEKKTMTDRFNQINKLFKAVLEDE